MHANQPTVQPVEPSDVLPFAKVAGEPLAAIPEDLYIPPDALEVFLEAFEGPLDLLLYLIKRQNLDILEIPIAAITEQYMQYIDLMESMRFELAAEYLLMAAMLAEIKSRMLLPRLDEENDDESDPRAELIRRLQEYERIKEAAENVSELPRMERDHHVLQAKPTNLKREIPLPDVTLKELLLALKDVADRAKLAEHCEFLTLFSPEEGRMGVVVTFLAVLELCKESLISIQQSKPFAPIYLNARISSHDEPERVDFRPAATDQAVESVS